MTLEDTLTSRDKVSTALRHVLDEATGKWGIRVNRVELKAVDPPASIQEAMEKQMRAERDRRAAILTAEGVKQSQILTAEGEKQSAILRAEGQREAQILQARGPVARRSRPSSTRSTAATPTPSCSPTSTSRCCRRSPRASRTRCGSSRARSPRRCRTSGRSSRRPESRRAAQPPCRPRLAMATVTEFVRRASRRLARRDLAALTGAWPTRAFELDLTERVLNPCDVPRPPRACCGFLGEVDDLWASMDMARRAHARARRRGARRS